MLAARNMRRQCSDVDVHRSFSNDDWTNQCVRVTETTVFDMNASSCNGHKCPPCVLLSGSTAVTIKNCGSNRVGGDIFVANINNDGKTVVVVSDGEVAETPNKILYSGESLYCHCNGQNSRLTCPEFSDCEFSLPQNQSCTASMP